MTARGVGKKNSRGPDPDDQPTVQIEKKGALTSYCSILTSAIFILARASWKFDPDNGADNPGSSQV